MARAGDKAWNEWLARHHAVVRRELASFRGREINVAGDGFFATFDGPARGVHCALSIQQGAHRLGLGVRAACTPVKWSSMTIRLQASPCTSARGSQGSPMPGETRVSSTVKDLVSGSGLRFEDRGAHALKWSRRMAVVCG